VGYVGTIATHARSRTVEDRRLSEVVLVGEPVPVWLVALVITFFPQSFLVGVDEESVPVWISALLSLFVVTLTHQVRKFPVPWIDSVWLMCCPTKSSYRLRAPGTINGSDFEGEDSMQFTAVVYALRSLPDIAALYLGKPLVDYTLHESKGARLTSPFERRH
jgi:hypothetical protein